MRSKLAVMTTLLTWNNEFEFCVCYTAPKGRVATIMISVTRPLSYYFRHFCYCSNRATDEIAFANSLVVDSMWKDMFV